MYRNLAVSMLLAAVVGGCGASNSNGSSQPATGSSPQDVRWDTPEELAQLVCPPGDVGACATEIAAAQAAGQPAAMCIGPQSDRWNIVSPAVGDRDGSACGPENLGFIRGIIIAP